MIFLPSKAPRKRYIYVLENLYISIQDMIILAVLVAGHMIKESISLNLLLFDSSSHSRHKGLDDMPTT